MHRIISTQASWCVLTVAWHIFIHVDAANEVAYELVAELVQEPRAEEQQEDAVEHAPEDLVNLVKYFMHLSFRSYMKP